MALECRMDHRALHQYLSHCAASAIRIESVWQGSWRKEPSSHCHGFGRAIPAAPKPPENQAVSPASSRRTRSLYNYASISLGPPVPSQQYTFINRDNAVYHSQLIDPRFSRPGWSRTRYCLCTTEQYTNTVTYLRATFLSVPSATAGPSGSRSS